MPEKRKEPTGIQNFKGYLIALARNHAFNFLKRAVADTYAKAEILKTLSRDGPKHRECPQYNDYKRYLDQLLRQLSPQSREVFRLCRQEGKTYDETAEILRFLFSRY